MFSMHEKIRKLKGPELKDLILYGIPEANTVLLLKTKNVGKNQPKILY